MKTLTIIAVCAALVSIGATAWAPDGDSQDADRVLWTQLFETGVTEQVADRGPPSGPRAGAPGASVYGFRVNNAVQGSAIITMLDRPALGVFVGLNVPNEFISHPYNDLRVVYTLDDASTRTVSPAAGSGTSMLFQSPDGLAAARIHKVALYVDQTAAWVK